MKKTKKLKKLVIVGLVIVAMSALTVTAMAASDYGSAAVTSGKTYTLEQMLTYAIQDENLANAEYAKTIEAYGAVRPFTNIVKAEQFHVEALERLFTDNGIAIPPSSASGYVSVPASLTDAQKAGVQAEKNNIAMYETFLAQALPDDIKVVFTALKSASEHHLAAFERSLSGTTGGQSGYGKGMNGQKGTGNNASGLCTGTGTGNMGAGRGTCTLLG